MCGLEFTPSTVVVGLIVIGLMLLAVRRMWRNGMCDCRKGEDMRGHLCGGCNGCSAVDKMLSDMDNAVKPSR